MSNTIILDAVEIVVYVLLVPLIVILGVRHGSTHSLGYIYLCVFAVLRVVADGLGIADRNSTNPDTVITVSAIHSAGLSPLLLVLAGFAHEAHHYLVKATKPRHEAQALLTRLRALQGVFHALSAGGMGLVVYGAIKSENSKDPDDTETWGDVRKAGTILMLLGAIAEAVYAASVWLSVLRAKKSVSYLHLTSMSLCTCAGGFFVCVRALYSVVYTFDTSADLNPVTGDFGYKLVFIVLVPFLAVAWMIAGAWVTRNIRNEVLYKSIRTDQAGKHAVNDDAVVPMMPVPSAMEWRTQGYNA